MGPAEGAEAPCGRGRPCGKQRGGSRRGGRVSGPWVTDAGAQEVLGVFFNSQ